MSSVFTDEAKRKLQTSLLNRLTMPSNLEGDTSREHSLLFSHSDVSAFLYGNTKQQPYGTDRATESKASTNFSQAEGANTWCDVCHKMSRGMCPRHAHLTQPLDTEQLTYAVKSIPPQCKRCIPSTTGVGYGMLANQDIPLGTWIGPFEGRRIPVCNVTPYTDTSFMWEIFEGNKLSHYIDASDENTSSWMRFIRCARHKDEQNLYAFQYNGNIYYRAFREIPCGTELLVWYDERYPMYMGIPLGFQDSTPIKPNQAAHDLKPDGTPLTTQAFNTVSPQRKSSNGTWYPVPTASQASPIKSPATNASPVKSPLWSCQGATATSDSKKMPALISTQTLQQRRTSVESLPREREQRSPPFGDVDSDSSSHGNNIEPSSYSELTTWQCQQCHKTFTQRVALQMHVCPRQPEKPYQCGQCSQAFTNPSDLRAHVVSHSTERPFKCGYCARTFVGATTLNNHIRTHMGQKPFGCKKCGKTFSQATHLARHEKDPRECSSAIHEPNMTILQTHSKMEALAPGHEAMYS